MLQHIQIRNLVIVRELFLDLEPGMTALTGETGAGKSILVDALGLALGGKADKSLIRNGCDQAEINAVFDISKHQAVRSWLKEQALDSDDECILRRVLSRQGRSRAFINSRPAPQALLRELGSLLISIHGQHEHQTLMRTSTQRELLDAWAGHAPLLQAMKDHYREYGAARRELEELEHQSRERAQRLDYLQFQIDELEKLNLAKDELDTLESRQKRLAHAEELGQELDSLMQTLFEAEPAVQPALARACVQLETLGRLDAGLIPAAELLESARIQVEEAVSLLREQVADIELDPALLEEIDARLGSIHELARKHHVNARELPGLLEQFHQERNTLNNADHALANLEQQVQELDRRCLEVARELSRSRQRAAVKLAETITASMQELGMQGGTFDVAVKPLAPEEMTANGMDSICFMVSANPGQPLSPLAKTASGGELSRISLSIQVATTSCAEIPTLIFDEVDSGIGGATAETVGRLLRQLGKTNQVLCVTHLPQVASQADHQMNVRKVRVGQQTETTIHALNKAQRIEEIARMLGGVTITDQTRAHAREMIG
ncbi:DNA repair protein RecN [Thiolapillus brandeum]|uniref:DNA repair protein RecN n=1 Tax=Thiolapillus brandeum TaxID=1076588 RepID=A0A7U6JHK7_9GAMM|nr:DNA repair protein RecN [Thiolapillus brandeum]BAO44436.1 DNA repair protein RecN [Thiolapillus brandeum]